jgi:sulfoxide reductase heme-binding subunit YedZ
MTSRRKIYLLRLATIVLLCLPAAELAWRWYRDRLGPLPIGEATLVTGDWAIALLLLSLSLTPARGVFELALVVHVRRRIGVIAALYALLHFGLYVLDQQGNLLVVTHEIAARSYLTIGFAALLILVLLAVISTDGWQRRLKRNWKRLNALVFAAALLALVHFFLQSKINAGDATLAAGLFAWLILWRLLPPRVRATYLGLSMLAVGATLAALCFELVWYSALKHIDTGRILEANFDPELAPRPVHKVLLAASAVIVAAAIRQLGRHVRLSRRIRKAGPQNPSGKTALNSQAHYGFFGLHLAALILPEWEEANDDSENGTSGKAGRARALLPRLGLLGFGGPVALASLPAVLGLGPAPTPSVIGKLFLFFLHAALVNNRRGTCRPIHLCNHAK